MMKKTMVAFILCLTLSFTGAYAAETQPEPVGISLDGEELKLEIPPLYDTENGRISIPIRPFSETLGAEVLWNEETDTATVVIGEKTMSYRLDELTMYQSSLKPNAEITEIPLDVPPVLVNDRTYVPVRALMEGFGFDVDWDEKTLTVILVTPKENPSVTDTEPVQDEKPVQEEEHVQEEQTLSEPEEITDTLTVKLYDSFADKTNFAVSPVSMKMFLGLMVSGASKPLKGKILSLLQTEDLNEYHKSMKNYRERMLSGGAAAVENTHIYQGDNFSYSVEIKKNDYTMQTPMYYAKHVYNTGVIVKEKPLYGKYIEEWTERNTDYQDKILPQTLEATNVESLFLSAINLKSDWKTPFTLKQDKQGFAQTDGGKEVEFMEAAGEFPYFENDRIAVAGLPSENLYTMYVVLAKDGVNPLEFTNHFEDMKNENMLVSIPKFEVKSSDNLKEFIKDMGLKEIICEGRKTSGGLTAYIEPVGHINDYIQVVTLNVDEQGMSKSERKMDENAQPKDYSAEKSFTADKAFSYFICDNENKHIIMMGRIGTIGD